VDVVKKEVVNKGRGEQGGYGEWGVVDSVGGDGGEVELKILNARMILLDSADYSSYKY
jgi:hypothetical protein